MLNAVTEEFENDLRGQLPDATFRPLTAKYLEEPRGRYAGVTGRSEERRVGKEC